MQVVPKNLAYAPPTQKRVPPKPKPVVLEQPIPSNSQVRDCNGPTPTVSGDQSPPTPPVEVQVVPAAKPTVPQTPPTRPSQTQPPTPLRYTRDGGKETVGFPESSLHPQYAETADERFKRISNGLMNQIRNGELPHLCPPGTHDLNVTPPGFLHFRGVQGYINYETRRNR